MLINIETNLSLKEIELILSNKTCHKYPFFYNENDFGINWVKNDSKFICLFYEDGEEDRHGNRTTLRSFFYGKLIKVNNKYRIIGITCANILHAIIPLLILAEGILGVDNLDFGEIFAILLFSAIFVFFNLNILKGNRKIKEYLERQFL